MRVEGGDRSSESSVLEFGRPKIKLTFLSCFRYLATVGPTGTGRSDGDRRPPSPSKGLRVSSHRAHEEPQ